MKKIYKWLAIIFTVILSFWIIVVNGFTTTYSVKVTDKEAKMGDYFVYTDVTTFKVEDTILFFRFDSSDFYGNIETQTCYDLRTFGLRIGILDMYPNIISFEKITCADQTSLSMINHKYRIYIEEYFKNYIPDMMNDIRKLLYDKQLEEEYGISTIAIV